MTDTYMIVGDDGEPIGMADMEKITDAGTHLAFVMAANSNDPATLDHIAADTIAKVGAAAFGYVATCALRTMTEHILSPSFDVADAHGTDLRSGMRAIAEGRQP